LEFICFALRGILFRLKLLPRLKQVHLAVQQVADHALNLFSVAVDNFIALP
jgi:hypothetical protein